VKLLLDTQLLIWLAQGSPRLSDRARAILQDERHDLVFSVVSIWEIAIKSALKRTEFVITADDALDYLRRGPFEELPVLAEHTLPVAMLPPQHGDPFDRLLVAQAISERMVLVTADRSLPAYGEFVRRV
jgi:PIN domain nuclease of toxin-antitoxin system